MSQWTHVNGSIRYDLFGMGAPIKEPNLTDNLPLGSEGPLTISYTDVYRNDHQAFVTVGISGDLRDYGDYPEDFDNIITWLSEHTANQIIRSGIIEIDIEHEAVYVYTYNNTTNKFELINTKDNQ